MMNRVTLLVLLVLLPAAGSHSQEAVERGIELLRNGKTEEALVLFRRAAHDEPTSAEAHNFYGLALVRQGAYSEGIKEIREALRLNPKYAEAFYNLGLAFELKGELMTAVDHFRSALELQPNFAEAEKELGIALAQSGDIAGAQAALQKALQQKPDMVDAHNRLGLIYSQTGDYQRAETHFREAIELDPNFAEAYNNLGVALQKKGDLQGATEALQHAVSINPKSPESLKNLGWVAQDRADLEASIRYFQQVAALEPSGEAYADLGYALKRSDRLPEATAGLRKAVALAPGLARAHFYLAETLALAGDAEAALRSYEAASRLGPDNVEFRYKYGVALSQTRPEDAAVELRRALDLYSRLDGLTVVERSDHLVTAHQVLGRVLLSLGDRAGATQQFQRARKIRAEADQHIQAVMYVNSGIESLKNGESSQAISILEKALTVQPELPDALHLLGIAYSAVENWEEANQAFLGALERRPSDAEIHFNFGITLAKQRDWPGAVREFAAAVQFKPSHAQALCAFAEALSRVGNREQSERQLRRARELGPCELGAP